MSDVAFLFLVQEGWEMKDEERKPGFIISHIKSAIKALSEIDLSEDSCFDEEFATENT